MFKGDFQSARDAATSTKKYLMVNIQDACEFPCQVLNRDVWSNEAVKTILKEHFIFWQVSGVLNMVNTIFLEQKDYFFHFIFSNIKKVKMLKGT